MIKASADNNLTLTHEHLIEQWSDKNTLKPEEVTAGSSRRIWWKCPAGEDHEWITSVYHRTVRAGGCPYCSKKRVCRDNCLLFKCPSIAEEWSTRNKLTPDNVTPRSGRKVWWTCSKDSTHEWEAAVSNRTGQNQGCPLCAGRIASDENRLTILFPSIAAEWSTKNTTSPDMFSYGSHYKAWWTCRKNPDHEWRSVIKNRTGQSQGCPLCAHFSKGEEAVRKVLEHFKANHGLNYQEQFRLRLATRKRPLHFDFAIAVEDKRALVEFQGIQHFKPVKRFGGNERFEDGQKRDQEKRDMCRAINVPLLEIPYTELKNVESIVTDFIVSLNPSPAFWVNIPTKL